MVQQIKGTTDVGVMGAIFLGFFAAIPWPEVAAFLAAVYTLIRICEWLYNVLKNKDA